MIAGQVLTARVRSTDDWLFHPEWDAPSWERRPRYWWALSDDRRELARSTDYRSEADAADAARQALGGGMGAVTGVDLVVGTYRERIR